MDLVRAARGVPLSPSVRIVVDGEMVVVDGREVPTGGHPPAVAGLGVALAAARETGRPVRAVAVADGTKVHLVVEPSGRTREVIAPTLEVAGRTVAALVAVAGLAMGAVGSHHGGSARPAAETTPLSSSPTPSAPLVSVSPTPSTTPSSPPRSSAVASLRVSAHPGRGRLVVRVIGKSVTATVQVRLRVRGPHGLTRVVRGELQPAAGAVRLVATRLSGGVVSWTVKTPGLEPVTGRATVHAAAHSAASKPSSTPDGSDGSGGSGGTGGSSSSSGGTRPPTVVHHPASSAPHKKKSKPHKQSISVPTVPIDPDR